MDAERGENKHPVRGRSILLPGLVSLVTGATVLLAGIAYLVSFSLDSPVGVTLLGIGVFLLVVGEMYCVFVCFMKSEKIDEWNKKERKKQKKEVYKMRRLEARRQPKEEVTSGSHKRTKKRSGRSHRKREKSAGLSW
jgi:hypothetical protein